MTNETQRTGWKQYKPRRNAAGGRESLLYERIEAGRVRCHLCAFRCVVAPDHVGVCGVRQNVDGTLIALNYGKVTAFHVDPVEKKPLFHVYPGARALSLAAPGCNFRCRFCQNHGVSQAPRQENRIVGRPLTPRWVAERAAAAGCRAVAFTYTEPTVYAEYALEVAQNARERGLKTLYVSNGYLTPEAVHLIAPWMDAANIDLKGFDDKFYLKVCGGRHAPVCDTIERMAAAGVWVEVSTVLIPDHNDASDEIARVAGFLASVNPSMPWHIVPFQPDYQMAHVPPAPSETLLRARDIGRAAGLRHVYVHDPRVEDGQTTFCAHCGNALIHRHGYAVDTSGMSHGACARCGAALPGIGLDEDATDGGGALDRLAVLCG